MRSGWVLRVKDWVSCRCSRWSTLYGLLLALIADKRRVRLSEPIPGFSRRRRLVGPDLHRLDRASFAWRTHSMTSVRNSWQPDRERRALARLALYRNVA